MSTLFDLLAAIGQFLTVWPGSPMRKRVFSPGFVSVCIIVVTLELAILIAMYSN